MRRVAMSPMITGRPWWVSRAPVMYTTRRPTAIVTVASTGVYIGVHGGYPLPCRELACHAGQAYWLTVLGRGAEV